MKPIITLLLSLLLVICNQCLYNKTNKNTISEYNNNDSGDSLGIHKSLVGVDSVVVIYWAIDANEYIFIYSQGNLQIHSSSKNPTFQKCIPDSHIIDQFLDYIDIFFITKSETIVISKVKRDPIVTDYPDITFKLYFENELVHKQTIQYGEEGYDIEYNPKFVEFYTFLDNLVPTPKS